MKLFVIRRPHGWDDGLELERAVERSKEAGDEMSTDVRWIRSYAVKEKDGTIGTFCVYEATSETKIREHAARARIPAEDIFPVLDTLVIRPDPVPVAA
jgi:hypothetical protein